MAKCTYNEECQLESWSSTSSKCILHCIKNENTNNNSDLFKLFRVELAKYIAFKDNFKDHSPSNDERQLIFAKLLQESFEGPVSNIAIDCKFNDINFPYMNSSQSEDLFKIIRKLKSMHFFKCSISFANLNVNNIGCVFEECIFKEPFYMPLLPRIENNYGAQYRNCEFEKNVYFWPPSKSTISYSLFHDCEFNGNDVSLSNLIIENKIFIFDDNKPTNINKIFVGNSEFNESLFFKKELEKIRIKSMQFNDCKFNNNFILNQINLSRLDFSNVQFNKLIEIQDCSIKSLEALNSEFIESADFFASRISEFKFSKSIFHKFAGFEKCVFGGDKNICVEFQYVSFLGITNFREAKFYMGLILDTANFKEAPNFLNSHIEYKGTTRETFRIIKNSFDKVGNYIEANKYFAFEMNKYTDNFKEDNKDNKNYYFDYFILKFNKFTSNFGQDYIKPIRLTLWAAFILYLITFSYENNWLYKVYEPANLYIDWATKQLNGFAKCIVPINTSLLKGMEFICLLFYILFATLIWQIIVAVKRHTKR